jgi:hypothetical protein
MTTETRYRPWLCHHCGVLLDTVGVVRGADAVPEQVELAVAVCIGYLDGHAWRPLRADELAALTPAGGGRSLEGAAEKRAARGGSPNGTDLLTCGGEITGSSAPGA